MSTPSLVGHSIRNAEDSEPVSTSASQINIKKYPHYSANSAYSDVDQLSKEGALLTDDLNDDLENMIAEKLNDMDLKAQLAHKRKPRARFQATIGDDDRSRSQSVDNTLVTCTDPIDYVSQRAPPRVIHNGEEITNHLGQAIENRSNKPHLARGDSYQNTSNEKEERSGRSATKTAGGADYLRSLSRSLNRKDGRSQSRSRSLIRSIEEEPTELIKEGALTNDSEFISVRGVEDPNALESTTNARPSKLDAAKADDAL